MAGLDFFSKCTLEASMHTMLNKQNCTNRLNELVKRGIPQRDAMQRINASCEQHKVHGETEDCIFWKCPCRFMHPMTAFFIQSAMAYKQFGQLPFGGGFAEQPANVMEAVMIGVKVLTELEEREREAASRKAKARQPARRSGSK